MSVYISILSDFHEVKVISERMLLADCVNIRLFVCLFVCLCVCVYVYVYACLFVPASLHMLNLRTFLCLICLCMGT